MVSLTRAVPESKFKGFSEKYFIKSLEAHEAAKVSILRNPSRNMGNTYNPFIQNQWPLRALLDYVS